MKGKQCLSFYILFFCITVSRNYTESASTLNKEALQLSEQGNYKGALEKLKKGTEITKISAIAYHNIGYTYELRGDTSLAVQNYETSIDRNPKLIPPRENLSKIYYDTGYYKEAIDQGEKVLELDPKNKKVIEWLPDAYKKYEEQRILENNSSTDIGMGAETIEDAFPRLRDLGWYPLKFSYLIAGGFFINKNKSPPRLILLPTTTRFPMYFSLQLKTLIQVNIRVATAPIPGILNPAFFKAEEALEFIYWYKKWFFGTGVLLSQFDTTIDRALGLGSFRLNTNINDASDWKIGLLGGLDSKSYSFSMTVYSRYLFRDPRSSDTNEIRIDRNLVSLVYKSKVSSAGSKLSPSFLGEFKINESYISEYQTSQGPVIGHYFGYYDFNIAIIFPNFGKGLVKFPLALGFKLINRIYFADLNDPDPSAFGNGQGFLGFNTQDALQRGNTFSGLRTNAHKILIFSSQRAFRYLSFQETIGFDYQPLKTIPVHTFSMYFQIDLRI